MAKFDVNHERREQRRRRRRRRSRARTRNTNNTTTVPDHASPTTTGPRKRSVSLDEATPTTAEPTLVEDSVFEDGDDYDDYDENVLLAPSSIRLDNDDGTFQASTLSTPTPRLPDELTVDGSMFSERYSLTVSHHQRITTIPLSSYDGESKQQEQHRLAVEQLRKTRRQHVRTVVDSGSSSSSGSSRTIGDFTFLGELQAVASDVSYFIASLKESLTEPHVAVCCVRPSYVSVRKRKPYRHRR